jgi:hypothetical protein
MKAKDFLVEKNLISVEIYNKMIINLITDNGLFSLNVDTSSIPPFSKLKQVNNFKLYNDILTADEVVINLNEVDILE